MGIAHVLDGMRRVAGENPPPPRQTTRSAGNKGLARLLDTDEAASGPEGLV